MQRQILFRAKTLQDYSDAPKGTWVYGYYTEASSILECGIPCIQSNVGDYIVDKDTLGMYIGKEDNRGKSIFEGDIISMPTWADCDGKLVRDGSEYFVVYYDEQSCGFCLDALHMVEHLTLDELEPDSMIVGNIYMITRELCINQSCGIIPTEEKDFLEHLGVPKELFSDQSAVHTALTAEQEYIKKIMKEKWGVNLK